MEERSQAALQVGFAQLADGDRSALSSVFELLWPIVRRFCRRALPNESDADDAAQATMEKVFAQVGRFDPTRSSTVSWVLTIAHWECRTVRRRAARSRAVPLDDAQLADAQLADAQLEGARPSPEAALIERDLEAAVQAAIEHLSDADQSTLRLTLREVTAAETRAPSFRKRKQRALARLKDVWRKLYGT